MAIRSGIQLCYPYEERRLQNAGRFALTWHPPYLVQPKLDGDRCRMIVENGRCLLLSSSEDIIPAVPHINKAGTVLPNGEYDGELYVHGLSHSEIHSIVSRETNIHPDHERMQYHIFDIISLDPQHERIRQLNALTIPTGSPIRKVQTLVAFSHSELMTQYEFFISKGYEGFVVRHMDAHYLRARTPALMKFKPKQKDHYRITGIYEAISEDGQPLGMIGGFNCIDDMGSLFSVGAGKLSHFERKALWEDWVPDYHCKLFLEIEYQTMSDKNKVPLFSRAVRILPNNPEEIS